jgi:hypothetical protein
MGVAMAGLLDMNQISGSPYRGLLGATLGLSPAEKLGVMAAKVGKASAPSPTPGGLLRGLAAAPIAALQADLDTQTRTAQVGLLAAQANEVQQKEQHRRGQMLFVGALASGRLPDTPGNRALATAYGLDVSKIWGDLGARPFNVAPTADGGVAYRPGALDMMSQEEVAKGGPRTALDIIGSFGKYHPPVPITAGGGFEPAGASPQGAQSIINQLVPGGLLGGSGNTQLRGDAGSDVMGLDRSGDRTLDPMRAGVARAGDLTQYDTTTRSGGSAPMTPQGLDIPASQGRQRLAPTKDAPGVQRGALEEDYGKLGVKVLEETRTDAIGAQREMQAYGQMRQALANGFKPGFETGFKDTATRLLMALGADESSVAGFFNQNPADRKAFQSATDGLVLAIAKTLGPNPSNADREFIRETLLSTRDTPQAVTGLLDLFERRAGQRIAKYDGMVDWVEQKKNPVVFDRNWVKQNGSTSATPPRPVERAAPTVNEIDEPTPGVQPLPRLPGGGVNTMLLKDGELRRLDDGHIGRFNRKRGGFEIVR